MARTLRLPEPPLLRICRPCQGGSLSGRHHEYRIRGVARSGRHRDQAMPCRERSWACSVCGSCRAAAGLGAHRGHRRFDDVDDLVGLRQHGEVRCGASTSDTASKWARSYPNRSTSGLTVRSARNTSLQPGLDSHAATGAASSKATAASGRCATASSSAVSRGISPAYPETYTRPTTFSAAPATVMTAPPQERPTRTRGNMKGPADTVIRAVWPSRCAPSGRSCPGSTRTSTRRGR